MALCEEQSMEIASEDTSEWPSMLQMNSHTPIWKQPDPIAFATNQCRKPYAGGKHGQPRWLALPAPTPAQVNCFTSSDEVGKVGSRGSCSRRSHSVVFTDVSSDSLDPAMEDKSAIISSPSKLMSVSNLELSTQSIVGENAVNFQSLLGSVVTSLQELTVGVHNLSEWHQTEQSGQAPAYLSAKSNIAGNDFANMLDRLSVEFTSTNSHSKDVIFKQTLSSRVASQNSFTTNRSVAGTSFSMRTSLTAATGLGMGHNKSTTSRRSARGGRISGKSSFEKGNLSLRPDWQFSQHDTEQLFHEQQIMIAPNAKTHSKNFFRQNTSAIGVGARSRHSSSSKKLTDNIGSRFLLHPHGLVKFVWDNLCLAALLFDLLVIPLQAFNLMEIGFFRVAEWAVTVLWTLDIFVTLFTGYTKGTRIIVNPLKIFTHYLKSWMLFDLAIVGLEWYSRISGDNFIGFGNVFRARCMGTVRTVRGIRLGKVRMFVRRVEDQVNSKLILLGLGMVKLTLTLLLMVHFITCIWFAIGESDPNGWTSYYNSDNLTGPKDKYFWYFASSRWTLAQINGRTDIDERRTIVELWYTCIVAVLFAALFMSIFVSSITSTMVELSAAAEVETTTGKLLNEYLVDYHVPKVLVEAARRYMRESKRMDDEDSEVKLLASLPKQLTSDLVFAMHHPTLVRNSFFAQLDDVFPRVMRQLCNSTQSVSAERKDDRSVISNVQVHKWEMVFDFQDNCNRMLFIEMGKLVYSNLYEEDSDVWVPNYADPDAHPPPGVDLGRGAWMSEASLWTENWINHGRCIATARTTLLAVDAHNFSAFIREYQDVHSKACSYARKFLELLVAQEVVSDIFVVELSYATNGMQHAVSVESKGSRVSQFSRLGKVSSNIGELSRQLSRNLSSLVRSRD